MNSPSTDFHCGVLYASASNLKSSFTVPLDSIKLRNLRAERSWLRAVPDIFLSRLASIWIGTLPLMLAMRDVNVFQEIYGAEGCLSCVSFAICSSVAYETSESSRLTTGA